MSYKGKLRSQGQMGRQGASGSREEIMEETQTDINVMILQELRQFKKDFKSEIREEMKGELKDIREEIRTDIQKEMGGISRKIDKLTKELSGIRTEVEDLTIKTKDLDKKTEQIIKEQQIENQFMNQQDSKARERCAKLRGIPEVQNEHLLERMIPILAQYLDISQEMMDLQIEKIYRVYSVIAKERNIPRDVVIWFTNGRLREKLCQRSYVNSLVVDDREIKIFRDLSPQILRKRREYYFLTEVLQRYEIRYRWDRVEGLTITYDQKKYRIDSINKAKEFLRKIKKRKKDTAEDEIRKENERKKGLISLEQEVEEGQGSDIGEDINIDLDNSGQEGVIT